MKNKFDWKVVVKTTELHSIDEYLTKWPSIVSKSNKVNCGICNSNGHKMRIQYRICSLPSCNRKCDTKYSLAKCLQDSKYQLGVINEHVDVESQSQALTRGMTPLCKEAIESILNEKNIKIPNRIYIELVNYNNEKYHLNTIPNLSKIQNYIKYRRLKNGDVNNIDGVSDFVNESRLKSIADVDMDETLFIGEEYGNGADESHFHLGMTSHIT